MTAKNEDFTITLPSNSNMDTNLNTQSDYTVTLRTSRHLEGNDWEVALLHVQYTPDWARNFWQDCTVRVLLQLPEMPRDGEIMTSRAQVLIKESFPVMHTTGYESLVLLWVETMCDRYPDRVYVLYENVIPRSYYTDVMALCKRIQDEFNEAFDPRLRVRMRFEMVDNMVQMYMFAPSFHKVLVETDYLCSILGLRKSTLMSDDTFTLYEVQPVGFRRPRLESVHSLYVYTDLIQYQAVGDTDAPLLGIVPVSDKASGARTQWTFNPPNYLPLNKTSIDTIRIFLRTDKGEPVYFASSADNVVCTLRFRRRRRRD